jgi:superoxide dismutase
MPRRARARRDGAAAVALALARSRQLLNRALLLRSLCAWLRHTTSARRRSDKKLSRLGYRLAQILVLRFQPRLCFDAWKKAWLLKFGFPPGFMD